MNPLRTIQLGSCSLRVYASPLAVPDHPWASLDDTMRLVAKSGFDQHVWLGRLRRELPQFFHELRDGVTLVAEPLVGGVLRAGIANGCSSAQLLFDRWTMTWVELFAAQNAHLPSDQWHQIIQEAGLRNVPVMHGVTVVQ